MPIECQIHLLDNIYFEKLCVVRCALNDSAQKIKSLNVKHRSRQFLAAFQLAMANHKNMSYGSTMSLSMCYINTHAVHTCSAQAHSLTHTYANINIFLSLFHKLNHLCMSEHQIRCYTYCKILHNWPRTTVAVVQRACLPSPFWTE